MSTKQSIKLTSDITVGTGDASDETELLRNTFIDTGFIEQLLNIENSKCIILGATGAGKTALIAHLTNSEEHVSQISPDDLSISYIHRSLIIQDMERCGVNLASVFRFMWQHALLVELIRLKFDVRSQSAIENWLKKLKAQKVASSKEYQAYQYMERWGHNIWESVGSQIKEMTSGLETIAETTGKLIVPGLSTMGGSLTQVQKEEKRSVYQDAVQSYISENLTKEAKALLDLCKDDFFKKKQKPYYIVIDDLDKDWAPDGTKNLLIKALLVAIKDLKKIPNIKIIVGLRDDIKHQLMHQTETAGFQAEKYESLELRLSWTENSLKTLATKRVSESFKRKYTNRSVNIEEIFSEFQINKKSPIEYIISRTRFRPRELILFLNACIEKTHSKQQNQISREILQAAERDYSSRRIQSVHDEWAMIYPEIKIYLSLLEKKPAVYSVATFMDLDLSEFSNRLVSSEHSSNDPIAQMFLGNDSKDYTVIFKRVLRKLVQIYFQCNIIGLRIDKSTSEIWAHTGPPIIEDNAIGHKTKMIIHPAFHSALSTDKREENKLVSVT